MQAVAGDEYPLASARAAELYGLEVIAEHVEDSADNVTWFAVLQRA